jgi:hypothetical protein
LPTHPVTLTEISRLSERGRDLNAKPSFVAAELEKMVITISE